MLVRPVVFTECLAIAVTIVHLLKLHQHFRGGFYVFLKFLFLHVLARTVGVHTVLAHLVALVCLFHLLWKNIAILL